MTVRILTGDCREVLRTLPDASVHCCVTSPPYFGLRDYGTAKWVGGDQNCDHRKVADAVEAIRTSTLGGGKKSTGHLQEGFKSECARCGATRIDSQIGLEPTPDAYVEQMVAVFREVRRVLRDDGTLWLNLGDSYANTGNPNQKQSVASTLRNYGEKREHEKQGYIGQPAKIMPPGLKPKDLIGIPWLVAFALRSDGWWLRQDNIWHKPNPMPESVTDRCTKAHEYLFMLVKSERYYFDAKAIAEPFSDDRLGNPGNYRNGYSDGAGRNDAKTKSMEWLKGSDLPGRNKRSVWTVTSQPFPEAHFATFPPDLIEPCIKAGCPETVCAKCGAPWVRDVEIGEPNKETTRGRQAWTSVTGQRDSAGGLPHRPKRTVGFFPSCKCDAGTVSGTVLDPFGGAGTTGLVADRLKRDAILIELNPAYADMAQRRITNDAPLFTTVLP